MGGKSKYMESIWIPIKDANEKKAIVFLSTMFSGHTILVNGLNTM